MGLAYLESFVSYCSDCYFGVINIHHYVQRSDCNVDQAVAALKEYVDVTVLAAQNKHAQLKGLPVCIGEVRLYFLPFLVLLNPWGSNNKNLSRIKGNFFLLIFTPFFVCIHSSGSGALPKMKVQSISRSYCLIWTHIRGSFATKLLAGSGKDDSSTMPAMGLRNLGLSIETTEVKDCF